MISTLPHFPNLHMDTKKHTFCKFKTQNNDGRNIFASRYKNALGRARKVLIAQTSPVEREKFEISKLHIRYENITLTYNVRATRSESKDHATG